MRAKPLLILLVVVFCAFALLGSAGKEDPSIIGLTEKSTVGTCSGLPGDSCSKTFFIDTTDVITDVTVESLKVSTSNQVPNSTLLFLNDKGDKWEQLDDKTKLDKGTMYAVKVELSKRNPVESVNFTIGDLVTAEFKGYPVTGFIKYKFTGDLKCFNYNCLETPIPVELCNPTPVAFKANLTKVLPQIITPYSNANWLVPVGNMLVPRKENRTDVRVSECVINDVVNATGGTVQVSTCVRLNVTNEVLVLDNKLMIGEQMWGAGECFNASIPFRAFNVPQGAKRVEWQLNFTDYEGGFALHPFFNTDNYTQPFLNTTEGDGAWAGANASIINGALYANFSIKYNLTSHDFATDGYEGYASSTEVTTPMAGSYDGACVDGNPSSWTANDDYPREWYCFNWTKDVTVLEVKMYEDSNTYASKAEFFIYNQSSRMSSYTSGWPPTSMIYNLTSQQNGMGCGSINFTVANSNLPRIGSQFCYRGIANSATLHTRVDEMKVWTANFTVNSILQSNNISMSTTMGSFKIASNLSLNGGIIGFNISCDGGANFVSVNSSGFDKTYACGANGNVLNYRIAMTAGATTNAVSPTVDTLDMEFFAGETPNEAPSVQNLSWSPSGNIVNSTSQINLSYALVDDSNTTLEVVAKWFKNGTIVDREYFVLESLSNRSIGYNFTALGLIKGDKIQLELNVSDGLLSNVTNSTSFTVNNTVPTKAVRQTPNSTFYTQNVSLNASRSFDNDSDILFYIWSLNGSINQTTAGSNLTLWFPPDLNRWYAWNLSTNDGMVNVSQGEFDAFQINTVIQPNVSALVVSPTVVYHQVGSFNITFNVTDNLAVDTVMVQIRYPNASTYNNTPSNSTTVYNYTFNTANTFPSGLYNVTILANDSSGNNNYSVKTQFNFTVDNIPPIVDYINTTPHNISIGNSTNITLNITDTNGVDDVIVEITRANGSAYNLTASVLSGTTYNVTILTTWAEPEGRYNISVFANDTIGNSNTSITDFVTVYRILSPKVTNVGFSPLPFYKTTPLNASAVLTSSYSVITANVSWLVNGVVVQSAVTTYANNTNVSSTLSNTTGMFTTGDNVSVKWLINDSASLNLTTTSNVTVNDSLPMIVLNISSNFTSNQNVTFRWYAVDNDTATPVFTYNLSVNGTKYNRSTSLLNATLQYALGRDDFLKWNITANDSAGVHYSTTYDIHLDSKAPTITMLSNRSPTSSSFVIEWSADENVIYELLYNTTPYLWMNVTSYTLTRNANVSVGGLYASQIYYYNVRVRDNVSDFPNWANYSVTLNVTTIDASSSTGGGGVGSDYVYRPDTGNLTTEIPSYLEVTYSPDFTTTSGGNSYDLFVSPGSDKTKDLVLQNANASKPTIIRCVDTDGSCKYIELSFNQTTAQNITVNFTVHAPTDANVSTLKFQIQAIQSPPKAVDVTVRITKGAMVLDAITGAFKPVSLPLTQDKVKLPLAFIIGGILLSIVVIGSVIWMFASSPKSVPSNIETKT